MGRILVLWLVLVGLLTGCGGSQPHSITPTGGYRYMDLSGRDLRGVELVGRDLTGAVLDGSDLRGVDLTGATLDLASLRGADLEGANLRDIDAFGACLLYTSPSPRD